MLGVDLGVATVVEVGIDVVASKPAVLSLLPRTTERPMPTAKSEVTTSPNPFHCQRKAQTRHQPLRTRSRIVSSPHNYKTWVL